ncbi:uncharacterized protein LOC124640272 [Helicoverpa zea]|uniref:uncharacterized protein LOC124640272 n=1 Tax=Helicoverpa zea TaxID=7113 RepID=UPI001F59AAF7|nr:uncharacterized protein LOC124640272 [Helicoverpa zea]
MEQMYLIEIFIDKVTVYVKENDEATTNKNLIIRVKFGPKVQFIIKEGQLAVNEKKDDIIETDEKTGRRQWSRTVRVGKSYLFPSYPDTILQILSKFPLEIEVWNDDDTEQDNIFVGIGSMHWDSHFFQMLKDSANACKIHEPLSIKSKTTIWAECCCSEAGNIEFILRLTALGESIITEFQQLMKDPEAFVFRTNKAPSMFQCKRVEGDDPNFTMVGSIYETTTLEDPDIVDPAHNKIEVCTELQSCGMTVRQGQFVCDHNDQDGAPKKKYKIDKIRMGDIVGPCGNKNCALAHKVKKYIRNLETYKAKAANITETKTAGSQRICGKCICKDDRWHREDCPESSQAPPIVKCEGCEGMALAGETCHDKKEKHFGTGATPKSSDTHVGYVYSLTRFPRSKQGMYGQDTIVENCFSTQFNSSVNVSNKGTRQNVCQNSEGGECSCSKSGNKSLNKHLRHTETTFTTGTNTPFLYNLDIGKSSMPRSSQVTSIGTNYNTMAYNVGTSSGNHTDTRDTKRKMQVYNCSETQEDKDCRCSPKKSAPLCKTIDCDCLSETRNILARKTHKPYCPSYKHKLNCPVTMMHEEEEQKLEEEEEQAAPLPYGLPPIQLGPCPILGRPCTVPDGFARMYKNAQLPSLPFSYSDNGKVCCSKEYERIKKAIKEYMKVEKGNDFRCINQFDVDTERRCCDKEQVLLTLMGRSCCGSHKAAIQEKYQEEEKKQP